MTHYYKFPFPFGSKNEADSVCAVYIRSAKIIEGVHSRDTYVTAPATGGQTLAPGCNAQKIGLYAFEPIPAGSYIIEYYGEMRENVAVDARFDTKIDDECVWKADPKYFMDRGGMNYLLARGAGCIANPSTEANASVVRIGSSMVLVAMRDIEMGEQIRRTVGPLSGSFSLTTKFFNTRHSLDIREENFKHRNFMLPGITIPYNAWVFVESVPSLETMMPEPRVAETRKHGRKGEPKRSIMGAMLAAPAAEPEPMAEAAAPIVEITDAVFMDWCDYAADFYKKRLALPDFFDGSEMEEKDGLAMAEKDACQYEELTPYHSDARFYQGHDAEEEIIVDAFAKGGAWHDDLVGAAFGQGAAACGQGPAACGQGPAASRQGPAACGQGPASEPVAFGGCRFFPLPGASADGNNDETLE